MKSYFKDPLRREYATKFTLIGLFISIFAGFVTRLAYKRRGDGLKLKPFDLALLGLSTYRLGRMVAYDHITEPLRRPFAQTVPDGTGAGESVEPRGEGMQLAFGQLLSCPICSGTWIAAGLTYALQTFPDATRLFLSVMSAVGLAEFFNSMTEAFSWTGQLARTLAGEHLRQQQGQSPSTPAEYATSEPAFSDPNLFTPGGSYYVRHDHEKHYGESRRP